MATKRDKPTWQCLGCGARKQAVEPGECLECNDCSSFVLIRDPESQSPPEPIMAKQKTIPGTMDEVPREVETAAEKYLKQKRLVAKGREQMNAALETLIEQMKAHDVKEMLVDDGDKRLVLDEKDVVKVTARKKKDGDGSDNDDDF